MSPMIDFSQIAAVAEEVPDPLPPAQDWHAARLCDADALARQPEGGDPLRFNILSLPAWLAVAARAGVASIPASEIASMRAGDFRLESEGDDDPSLVFETAILDALGADEVLRFEHVASSEVKHDMSEGQPLRNGTFWSPPFNRWMVPLFDERFYTTLLDFAPDRIRAYARPKIRTHLVPGQFRDHDGAWPVEFRVFVVGGRVVGVSNYYPQVALEVEAWRGRARECVDLAQEILDAMERLHIGVGNCRLCPDAGDPDRASDWIPAAWGPQDFTLDFLLDAEAEKMVLLEGGPAGLQAAHPCCFTPRRGHPAEVLSGAVFAEDAEPIPLADL